VEGPQEAVAVAVAALQGDLPGAHQAVLLEEHQGVLLVAADPEVLHLQVVLAGLRVIPFRVCQEVPDHRKGHRLGPADLLRWRGSLGLKDPHRSPTGLAQVPALVFGGGFVVVGFSDPLLVDIAGGVVAMTDQPLVETILSTR
jgi:hypothetical protein